MSSIVHQQLVPEPIRLDYHDFCALPVDGRRYEILDGDLYMSPSPTPFHQSVALNLAILLRQHVVRHRLGRVYVAPLDVILGPHDIVEPDIIFVGQARRHIVTEQNVQGAPDLLIEVLSPSNAERDERDKRNIYARCGVPFYWIVDPQARRVVELQLVDATYAVASETSGDAALRPRLFPELTIELTEVWEG